MRLPVFRWLFSYPASIVFCTAAVALHEIYGHPPGLPALGSLAAGYLLVNYLVMWVLVDARRRRHRPSYDAGLFLSSFWMVLVPAYLFRIRGWRALVPIGWFVLLYGLGWGLACLAYLIPAPLE